MNKKKPKSVRYPWNEWFKRKHAFKLIRGRDFFCMTHSMAQQIRNAAYLRNLQVSITIDQYNTLVVEVMR